MWLLVGLLLMFLIEIRFSGWAAGVLGGLPAFLLCILAGIAGSAIMRIQGTKSLMAAQEALARRERPDRHLFDGMCGAFAGILLIIPGFFTDLLAFLLLNQPVRRHLYRIMGGRFDEQGRRRDPSVIDGEYTRVDHEKLPPADSPDHS
jgi:UPF0716 protein FxsA